MSNLNNSCGESLSHFLLLLASKILW